MTHIRAPFKIIALLLSKLYGRANGNIYNVDWLTLMYYVAMEGTIFNWEDIATRNLAKYVN